MILKEKQFLTMRLPRTYWAVELDKLPEGSAARRKIETWMSRLDNALRLGYGLIFHGDFRQGKTACLALCLMAAVESGKTGLFTRADEMVGAVMEREEYSELETLAQHMVSVDVLAIDDLGQEKFRDEGKAIIERVVRRRYDAQRAVLVSTNSLETIDKAHGGICRLIRARCEPVELKGMAFFEAEKSARELFFR